MNKLFSSKVLSSAISSSEPSLKEKIFGYFIGPCLIFTVLSAAGGNFLTQFYTDVLGMSGLVITLMPLLSKILSSVVGIFFGNIVENTRTTQGKARPWILLSGILLALSGVLLYWVPDISFGGKVSVGHIQLQPFLQPRISDLHPQP